MLSKISMIDVHDHYVRREQIHRDLTLLLNEGNAKGYAELALGITDPAGNYSAAEHGLGPKILTGNTAHDVLDLGLALRSCVSPAEVPTTIYGAGLDFLKISVGSEMTMMLRPDVLWVANKRSVWGYLLAHYEFDYARANDALHLYSRTDPASEMAYDVWGNLYPDMQTDLDRLVLLGNIESQRLGIAPGSLRYLWADAICNGLYEARET